MFRRARELACILVVGGALFLCHQEASAQPPPPGGGWGSRYADCSFFYEALALYGEWTYHRTYGWVWSPYDVSPDWRPYMCGNWVWTECGWTFVSDEPFGWATYHYGRWYFDPFYGWVWIPGTRWGPAWVAWRIGDGWIGWAALPPGNNRLFGLTAGDFSAEVALIKRFSWNFVEENRFVESNLRRYIVKPVRNVHIVNETNNVTSYNIVNNTIINKSINVDVLEKRIGRKIPQYKIREADSPTAARVDKRDTIRIYRPRVDEKAPARTPDVILGKGPKPPTASPDRGRQYAEDRAALERRLGVERQSMMDRQARETARVGKMGISADEMRKRHQMERSAFEEQVERERKLVERYQQRDQKGENGPTRASGPRYKFPK